MEGERVAARSVVAVKRVTPWSEGALLYMKSWSTTVRQGRNDKSVQQSAGSEIRTIRQEEG